MRDWVLSNKNIQCGIRMSYYDSNKCICLWMFNVNFGLKMSLYSFNGSNSGILMALFLIFEHSLLLGEQWTHILNRMWSNLVGIRFNFRLSLTKPIDPFSDILNQINYVRQDAYCSGALYPTCPFNIAKLI